MVLPLFVAEMPRLFGLTVNEEKLVLTVTEIVAVHPPATEKWA
jgi:hypothetical protein